MWNPSESALLHAMNVLQHYTTHEHDYSFNINHTFTNINVEQFHKTLIYIIAHKNNMKFISHKYIINTAIDVVHQQAMHFNASTHNYFAFKFSDIITTYNNTNINTVHHQQQVERVLSLLYTYSHKYDEHMWNVLYMKLKETIDTFITTATTTTTVNNSKEYLHIEQMMIYKLFYLIIKYNTNYYNDDDDSYNDNDHVHNFINNVYNMLLIKIQYIINNSNSVIKYEHICVLLKMLLSIINTFHKCDNSKQQFTIDVLNGLLCLFITPKKSEPNDHSNMFNSSNAMYCYCKIWLALLTHIPLLLNEHYSNMFDLFSESFTIANMNNIHVASEFYMFITSTAYDQVCSNENIKTHLKTKLHMIIPSLLHGMELTEHDIQSQLTKNISLHNNINTPLSLRKTCCRIIDKLSFMFPYETFINIRPHLENELQSTTDLIKERSILAFGAIAKGCYTYIITHLKTIIPFLLRELQHPNKHIRTIACWSLSRYTKFILLDNDLDNKDELIKEYLTEILKKFLDKERIVRESAGTAFKEMVYVNKEILEPYMFDIVNIIINVFDHYEGSNLLSVYEILLIIMNAYQRFFANENDVEDIVKCIVQKWYDLVKLNDTITLPLFFEVINALVKACGNFLERYCEYFLIGCLKIIEISVCELKVNMMLNNNDKISKELFTKALNTLTLLIQVYPMYVMQFLKVIDLFEYLFEVLKLEDHFVVHYALALIGELIKAGYVKVEVVVDQLYEALIPFVDVELVNTSININSSSNSNSNSNSNNNSNSSSLYSIKDDKLLVCNNAIWALGLLIMSYPQQATAYTEKLMLKFSEILKLSKVRIYINVIYML